MADVPYPITSRNPEEVIQQIRQLIDELFQERVAGTLLGDVFTVGNDDVLTLQLSTTGGLEKTSSTLAIKCSSTGGVQTGANGVALKLDPASDNRLTVSATGLKMDQDNIWPVGSIFIATVATNPNTLLGFGTWVLQGVGDLTLT